MDTKNITSAMVKELRELTLAPMMACKRALESTNGDMEAAVSELRKSSVAKAEKRADKTAAQGKIAVVCTPDHKSGFMIELNSETDFVARDSHFTAFAGQIARSGLAHRNPTVESVLSNQEQGQSLETMRVELVSRLGENIRLRRVALVESPHYVGFYCHGDRIGVLIALHHPQPTLAAELSKDIAMHIAAAHPKALYETDVPAILVAKEREIFMAQAEQSGKSKEIAEKMVEGRIRKFLQEISLVSQPFVKDPNVTIADLLKQHNAKIESFVRFEVGEGIEKEVHNFAEEVMAQVKGIT